MSLLSRWLCVSLIVASSGSAFAGIVGPFEDGELHLPGGSLQQQWVYHTVWWGHTSNGQSIGGTDLLFNNWDGSIDVWLFGMVFGQPGGPGGVGSDQELDLITVHGNRPPGASVITGFEPDAGLNFDPNPAVGFDGREQHWGRANPGKQYFSYFGDWVVANQLPGVLPGADLSLFDTTSTTQSYRVYKTTVELRDYVVPEPSTWALGAVGMLGVAALTRRSRRSRAAV